MFKDFQRKLQQDTKKTVDAHVHASSMRHSSELKVAININLMIVPHLKKFKGLVSTEVDDVSDITSYISFSFLDIVWLKFNTKLSVLIKGVLTREDAVKAMEVGVERIIVSNHGARQLDYVPAIINALEEAYTIEHEAKVSKLKEHNQKLKRKLLARLSSYFNQYMCFSQFNSRRKIPESPWGSPIPIGDGDGDVNRFPDGDGDGDGDEAEKRG
ncbi:peroxisomal (S)-2-hydroxy-acid oxidase GLO4-like protein [Tanacetum coccineum]